MRAYARQQPLRASCEPRQRASTLRRVRRSERHGMRQRIRRVCPNFDMAAFRASLPE